MYYLRYLFVICNMDGKYDEGQDTGVKAPSYHQVFNHLLSVPSYERLTAPLRTRSHRILCFLGLYPFQEHHYSSTQQSHNYAVGLCSLQELHIHHYSSHNRAIIMLLVCVLQKNYIFTIIGLLNRAIIMLMVCVLYKNYIFTIIQFYSIEQ